MSNHTMSTTSSPISVSITNQINYLPTDHPVQWSSAGHGTFLEHARSCWTAYTDWRTASSSWAASIHSANISYQTTSVFSDVTFYIPTSTTIWPTTSVSTYTLCDGTPRADVSPFTTHYISTNPESRPIIKTIAPQGYEAPEPSCLPDVIDCAVYYFRSNLGYYQQDTNIIRYLEGRCGLPVDWPGPCLIQGGPAQLIYFPVPSTTDLVCGHRETAVFPTTVYSPPPLVTTLGHTFAADSAYISFETIYAGYRSYDVPGGQGIQVGPTFTNAIFSFHSSEISTNCFGTINPTATTTAGYGYGTQLNFADLNSPVPASAYKCQNQCMSCFEEYSGDSRGYTTKCITPDPCPTIWNNFNPLLAVPTRLREIVPEWSTCSFWDDRIANLIFDPPIALHTAEVVASASLFPVDASTSTRVPGPIALPPAESVAQASISAWESSSTLSVPASVTATPTPTALPDLGASSKIGPAPSSTIVIALPTNTAETLIQTIIASGSTFLGMPSQIGGTNAIVVIAPSRTIEGTIVAGSLQTLYSGSSMTLGNGAAVVVAGNSQSGNMGSYIVNGIGGTTQLPGQNATTSESQHSSTGSGHVAASTTKPSDGHRQHVPILVKALATALSYLLFQ